MLRFEQIKADKESALFECGSTTLQADVPGQTPILALATPAAAVIGVSELIKQVSGRPGLDDWLAHDMRRNPEGPGAKTGTPSRLPA